MIYLSTFTLSQRRTTNPNLYPYSVFARREISPFVFAPITVFYGDNGCGKSTLLNLIAQKIGAEGYETYRYGQHYIDQFLRECRFTLAEDDMGQRRKLPDKIRYIKSEDILYEIKKIQQEDVLKNDYYYEQARRSGMSKEQAERELYRPIGLTNRLDIMEFAQEKYSNGETAMQLLSENLEPDALYLLDEPEVSLSPQNQVRLAQDINHFARLLGCQFIIASHSPFMLGTLNGKIYNLDSREMEEAKWTELENIRYFYEFFQKRQKEFE